MQESLEYAEILLALGRLPPSAGTFYIEHLVGDCRENQSPF